MSLEHIKKNCKKIDGVWFLKKQNDYKFLDNDGTNWPVIEDNSFWYKHRNNIITTIIRKHHISGAIYEVGAGNGAVAIALQNQGYEIITIEPTLSSTKNQINRGIHNVCYGTLELLDFPTNSISNIGLFDVLEHVKDDKSYLKMIAGLLQKNGKVYITVPAYSWLWSLEDSYAEHWRRYTTFGLIKLLKESGFKIEYKSYFFSVLIVPILIIRTIPSFLKLYKTRTVTKTVLQHYPKDNIFYRLMSKMLNYEVKFMANGGSIKLGASIIIVASIN